MKKVIIAQLSVQENKVNIFLDHAKIMVAKSNEEAGCLTYKLLNDFDKENDFFIYEEYKNEKAIADHNASGHFKEFLNSVMPLLTKKPTIETF
ncbi:putative quinol monooxygenase [Aquimarina sp. I32.4]|uniref:putative quinol monooxygenase n=1 Tax=Aquimarina sp. I32.4 TaxID=2053903 RepID=UPI000CDECF4C|nr:putative quinol monooxygenase [Aquimarina sp. I32.4]